MTMPEIPQYYRQQRLAASAGNVIANVPPAGRELAGLGRVFTELGFASEEQRLEAEYHDQMAAAQLQVAKQFENYQIGLDVNDTANYLNNLDKLHQSYDAIKLKNGRAANDFGEWLNKEKLSQKTIIEARRRSDDARNFLKNFNINVDTSLDLATHAATDGEYNRVISDNLKSLYGVTVNAETGKLEMDENFSNALFDTDEVRMSGARQYLAEAEKFRTKELKKRFMAEALREALARADGLEYIRENVPEMAAGLGLPLEEQDRRKLVSDYNFEKNLADYQLKEAIEIQQNRDKQTILNRFIKHQFGADPANGIATDINDFINESSLDPDEKEQWMNKARSWSANAGKDIKTDPVQEARLEQMARNISTGSVKYDDFVREITDAAYGKNPTINEKSFTDLMSLAGQKHTAYQANAMGEAVDYGLRQLTHTDEEITRMYLSPEFTSLSQQEQIKWMTSIKRLSEENFSQYKKAMNDWFAAQMAAGKDPSADDIYIQSRKLATHYRGRELTEAIYQPGMTPEQKAKVDELAQWFTKTKSKQAGTFPDRTPEGMIKINTKAELDALPAGTLFVAPDGSVRNKK